MAIKIRGPAAFLSSMALGDLFVRGKGLFSKYQGRPRSTREAVWCRRNWVGSLLWVIKRNMRSQFKPNW